MEEGFVIVTVSYNELANWNYMDYAKEALQKEN
jgi:hypothetical protein